MNRYLIKSFDFQGDAFDLFKCFRHEPHAFFLDSSSHDRYSFIGFDPFDVFVHKGKDALDVLREKFNRRAGGNREEFASIHTPLTSGIVGCLGYDYGLHHEKIELCAQDDLGLPDAVFGFYDCILTIDHLTEKLFITSTGLPESNEHLRKMKASKRLDDIVERIEPYFGGPSDVQQDAPAIFLNLPTGFRSNLSKEQYKEAVRKALDYIGCGDIYQVNLSQRFEFDLKDQVWDPFKLYQALRDYSPVSFGGYFDGGDFSLISNSPERFLQLNGRVVHTRPMKGTRPRGQNAEEDQKLRAELVESAKEKAELLMITDLLRNDLGRVCDYGSVVVKDMRTIEEYKYVFQATSTIEGVLKKNKGCFDLLQSCFPGGSITGCPKIRSMEIIEELEPTRRGMYTGAMGYINFDGNMDFNILIRTLLARRNKLYFHVGAGIVADSVPQQEYEETLVKARSMQASLEKVFLREGQVVGIGGKGGCS